MYLEEQQLNRKIEVFNALVAARDRHIMEGIEYSKKYNVDVIFHHVIDLENNIDSILWVDFNAHPCNHNFKFQNVVAIAHNGEVNVKEIIGKESR